MKKRTQTKDYFGPASNPVPVAAPPPIGDAEMMGTMMASAMMLKKQKEGSGVLGKGSSGSSKGSGRRQTGTSSILTGGLGSVGSASTQSNSTLG